MKHFCLRFHQPSKRNPLPGDTFSTASLFARMKKTVGEVGDVCDSLGRWFEGIVKESSARAITVHFVGWANEFDEPIPVSSWSGRTSAHGTKVPNWRAEVKDDSKELLEYFHPVLEAWTPAKVLEVSEDGVSVKLDVIGLPSLKSEWTPINLAYDGLVRDWKPSSSGPYPATVAPSATVLRAFGAPRAPRVPQARNPNGTDAALRVAAAFIQAEQCRRAFSIYKVLLAEKCFPADPQLFATIATLLETRQVYACNGVEERRLNEATLAHFYDKAVALGLDGLGDAFAAAAPPPPAPELADVSALYLAPQETRDVAIPTNSFVGADGFLRSFTASSFATRLAEDWPALPSVICNQLTTAEALLVSSAATRRETTSERCLRFATAAFLLEQAAARCRTVIPACYFHLARMYVLGLGVDVTQQQLQDVADIQTSEYLESPLALNDPDCLTLHAVLNSVGRCTSSSGSQQTTAASIARMLTTARERGSGAAAYWHGQLLMEAALADLSAGPPVAGGPPVPPSAVSRRSLSSSQVSLSSSLASTVRGAAPDPAVEEKRRADLLLAKTCFTLARDVLLFQPAACTSHIKRLDGWLAAAHRLPLTCAPYLQALHIFQHNLVATADKAFRLNVLCVVKDYARTHGLPYAERSRDDPQAEWVRLVSEQVRQLQLADQKRPAEEGGEGPGKGQAPRLPLAQIAMFMRQQFALFADRSFVPQKVVAPPAETVAKDPDAGSDVSDSDGDGDQNPVADRAADTDGSVSELELSDSGDADEPDVEWTRAQAGEVLALLHALRTPFSAITTEFLGLLDPLEEAKARFTAFLKDAPVHTKPETPLDLLAVKRAAYLKFCTTTWEKAVVQASKVHASLRTVDRTLAAQLQLHHAAMVVMGHEERSNHAEAIYQTRSRFRNALSLAQLGQQLAEEEREPHERFVVKYLRSAEALELYCKKPRAGGAKWTLQEAKRHLRAIARSLLGHLCNAVEHEYIGRIGYQAIIDAEVVAAILEKQRGCIASHVEARLAFLRNNPTINQQWRGTGRSRDKALLDLYRFMEAAVTQLEVEGARRGGPCLQLSALTIADPWFSLAQIDVDGCVEDVLRRGEEVARDTGMDLLSAQEQLLFSAIDELMKVVLRSPSCPASFLATWPGVRGRLHGYPNIESNVILLKKFLFFLRNTPSVVWDAESAEQLAVLASTLENGLQGRCPDGISSFCDGFLRDLTTSRSSEAVLVGLSPEVAKLIAAASMLVYSHKVLFIRKHLARGLEDYESRTSLEVTLQCMLMLPLSLNGTPTVILYPDFAVRSHRNPDRLRGEAVLDRFLNGGDLQLTTGEVVTFPKLTLHTLIELFRDAIVVADSGARRSNARERETAEDTAASGAQAEGAPGANMLPHPRITFTIDEDTIVNFLANDIVLSAAYTDSKDGDYSHESKFFRPAVAADDDTDSVLASSPLVVQIMKDAAFVRLLQVCQYCAVPADFYDNVPIDFVAA